MQKMKTVEINENVAKSSLKSPQLMQANRLGWLNFLT